MSLNHENILEINDLEQIISIRQKPHIYAFSTNTLPNYIKVGDTFRPINTRLNEWKKIFNDLQRKFPNITKEYEGEACFKNGNTDIYFRDYSVHKYLISKGYSRLEKEDFISLGFDKCLSNEFFKEMPIDEIKNAIQTIKEKFNEDWGDHTYYNLQDKKEDEHHWNNTEKWILRANQEKVVNNFKEKVNEGKNELLMYAVMRFGKSFTSMCCAQIMGYKKILIVSAKADVKNEWKKTVEKPEIFKEYRFLCDEDLKKSSRNIIEKTLQGNAEKFENKKAVAMFLTLQNLSGLSSDGQDIKKRLEQVFNEKFDLIIIDETHYGAWANIYGSVFKSTTNDDEDFKSVVNEINEHKNILEKVKYLNGNVKLHLSGTPYNLLYENSFKEDDMIASCQFSDILIEKEKWDEDNLNKINPLTGEEFEEYDNPYFGFPKMLRFAFNLPKSAQEKLVNASKDGKWNLNKLFETKGKDKEKKFINHNEVLNLLKVIDGKEKDDAVLSFLNIPKIKNNDVCKHIVMVLHLKSACDAMEDLLDSGKINNCFVNLKNYKVINIAGHNSKYKTIEQVKEEISQCEKNGEKTICLTVNKMLTGVTVPEWDTMIMFKNTKSAQEYDQAIFRIQNQFVEELPSNKNDNKAIKIDKKPQTILVDFDPVRMFEIQGLSSRIVNDLRKANNEKLDEKIETELKFFPIITYNADKLVKVTPRNIVEIISNYNKEKSIIDEALDVEFDVKLLNNNYLREYISKQYEKGIKNALKDTIHTSGEFSSVEILETQPGEDARNSPDEFSRQNEEPASTNTKIKNNELKSLKKKYASCVALLLFYSFLTKSKIYSLRELQKSFEVENQYQQDNDQIIKNLGIDKQFIKLHLEKCDKIFAYNVDSKIASLNLLSHDKTITTEQKLNTAIKKFSRISESEVVTPVKVCFDILDTISKEKLIEVIKNEGKILDIASKTGEFSYAIFNFLKDVVDKNKLKQSIFSIPTSSISYELTKRIYDIIGLPIENISKFTSYDLIKIMKKHKNGNDTKEIDYDKINKVLKQNKKFCEIKLDDNIKEGGEKVKFSAIVGNPPYQENISNNEGNKSLGKQLFPNFIKLSAHLTNKYLSLITPSRWFTSEGQDGSFIPLREWAKKNNHFSSITNILDGKSVFSGTELGAVNYFFYNKDYVGNTTFIDKGSKIVRPLFEDGLDMILSMNEMVSIINKVKSTNFISFTDITKGRDAFGVVGKKEEIEKNTKLTAFDNSVEVRCAHEAIRHISRDKITKNIDLIDKWKIFTSKGNGGAGTLTRDKAVAIIGRAYIGGPNTICTDSLIPIGEFKTQQEALNLKKYMETKFLRFMVGILKVSQNIYQNVYQFVPLQDLTTNSDIDWFKAISEIDQQLYKKYNLTLEEVQYIEKMIKPMD